ncbi:serine hydrolase domain-containing protein [Pseudoflavitalea sp. G-6-1-2]|uniref:serine hydrolase domain-containing protein n=1 Tax=Pseudoflavitalea sp. G-6-1-2 TaxID=2728841 RepID=UPI001980BD82|nr:serine hydrolase domain-containing protein [Pseudoflavitalea sp. G-6-1-2]
MQRAFRMGLFNGNLLVVDKGKPVYSAAIGFADSTHTKKLTTDHRFHIGSIAKEFNSVAIMLLVQQGKLKLSDPVTSFLPDMPAWMGKITVLHLLQYRSGLPNVNWDQAKSDADIMKQLKETTAPMFEPGTSYAYYNTNVFLQRRIVEKISGLSFNQFVKQYLLIPAKMKTALVDPAEKDPLVARCFDNDNKQGRLEYTMSGWTSVTLADFYNWSVCLEKFCLLTPDNTRQILIPAASGQQAGLGKGAMENNLITRHEHDGTADSYQALLVSNPTIGRLVILLTNNKQNNLGDINTCIQAILDDKPYTAPRKKFSVAIQKELDTIRASSLIDQFEKLKMHSPDEYYFNDEYEFNSIGYVLLSKQRIDEAIKVFEYNTKLFPASGNVWDSLGEAYLKQGDKANALRCYKKAVSLDPGNTGALKIIAELEKH